MKEMKDGSSGLPTKLARELEKAKAGRKPSPQAARASHRAKAAHGNGYAALMRKMARMKAGHTGGSQQSQLKRTDGGGGGGGGGQEAAAPSAADQRQAAEAQQVMLAIKDSMSKIQAISMHTRGHPHGAALKQIGELRATMKKQVPTVHRGATVAHLGEEALFVD